MIVRISGGAGATCYSKSRHTCRGGHPTRRTERRLVVIRTSLGRPIAAFCLCLMALAGCERSQPGPKPISGGTSAPGTPNAATAPATTGASATAGTPR
ncbi:hypothetical protein SAMN05216345_108137 [Cupriavidus sp. YR651]|nr:hypothetical protein SAMN05216345_108137 [Cupriavidus sp. YR651]